VASANVNLVRSIFAAWELGDYTGSAEWAHPDIEFVFADGPSPGTWTGLVGLAEAWRGFLSVWEGWRSKADEYRELDGDRVFVLVHYGGRGKTSGLDVAQMPTKTAGLFHIGGGRVTRLVFYFDREHALADLGLAPEARSPGTERPR
jgi:ketosteroid isomerase-like protein